MKPIFTIHAGEYLVGEFIEQNYKELNVWVPSKDTGIDLLVTNKENKKAISLQVKLSKDFLINNTSKNNLEKSATVGGWFQFNRDKLKNSKANYWVLILVSYANKANPFHLIIKPSDLLNKLEKTHGADKPKINFYFWVIKTPTKNFAIDGRGLDKDQKNYLLDNHKNNTIINSSRDYSEYLDNWECMNNLTT